MDPAEEVQDGNPQNAAVPKYKRKSGACNLKGPTFEIKMAALVYLRAKRLLKSFALSTNDPLGGGFDDIVLAYNRDFKKHELLVQLKHLNKPVTKDALASESGRLSLNELFSSVESRFIPPVSTSSPGSDNPQDTVFILFTNTAVNLGTSQHASNIDPIVNKLLCTSDTDCILKVDINDKVFTTFKEKPGATEFVRHFFIFSSQADVDHLDEVIKQEFIKLSFRIIPNYRNLEIAYLSNIKTYWEMTGNVPYLTENWGEWSSVQDLLTGKDKLLPHIRFDEEVLNTLAQKLLVSNHQKIHIVCTDSSVLLTSMKVNQALVKLMNQRHLFTSTDEQEGNLNIVLKLWESNSYDILIIGWDSTYRLEIHESIFQNKRKKLILISDGRRSISDIFTDKLVECWYGLKETFSFSQLDNSSQETVLNQPIHLQGIEVKMYDLGVRKEFLGESLMSFLNCGNIQLGHKLEEFPCKSYIPRTLYKQVAIKKDILAVAQIPNKVCVEGLTNEEMKDEINKVRMSKDLGNTQETTKVKSVANADIHSQHSEDPIHILEMKDDMLYWRCSSGDPGYLYEFLNVTEGEIEDVKHFMENCKVSNPKEDVLVTAGLRKVIVVGEPGIGKSDLFLHIAHKLKGLYPAFWVIPLNLEHITKYMIEQENHIVNKESVFRMLAFAMGVQECPVAKTFLEEAIEYSGKIFILCDGFDEIYPKCSELVLEVFNIILKTKVRGLWVSTRQAALVELETCLQAKAFSLEPFTKDEALRYLSDILGPDDANNIIKLIQKSTSVGANPVSSNPLHLMMICDLKVSGGFPTKGKMLNLYEMYRSFMSIKLKKYLNNTVKDTHMHIRDIFEEAFMKLHMICSIIALDILNELQEEQRRNILQDFKKYREIVGGGHEKTGIIDGLSEDGRPRFVHRTFAEYFAAGWLEINKDSNLKYISKITFDTNNNVLRAVFNRLLAENCPIHLAVLDNDILDLRERLQEKTDLDSKDAGGRTPLHLASLSDDKVAVEMMKVLLCYRYKPNLELRDKLLNSTPLYYAVKGELWDGVKLLLQHGALVENGISECSYVTDLKEEVRRRLPDFTINLDLEFEINWPIFVEYKTILHLAAISGSEDCVKTLLENGANIEMRDVNGDTPLHLAVSSENELIVELLLYSGAFTAAVNKNGDTPLHVAIMKRNLRMVRTLLQYKASTRATNKHGDTPLHIAAMERRASISIIELLFQNGARANVKNKYGDTPLREAIRCNNLDVVQLLLDRGATTTVQANNGHTLLHEAVIYSTLDVVQLLLDRHESTRVQNIEGDTPLHVAVRCNKLDVVQLLLDRLASTTVQNNDGDTPLHVAVRYSTLGVVQLLLDRHASTTVQNKYRETPLHIAVSCSKLDMVQLLLDRHESTTIQNIDGDTPLHIAVRCNKLDVVQLLLDRHASTTVQNINGDTPLHIAVKHYNLDVFKLLLDRGASTTVRNIHGETPLHIAVKHYNLDMFKLLLDRGASTKVQNNIGDTPLHEAVRRINLDVVKLLLDRGASTTVKNKFGETPLHIAVSCNNLDEVKILLDRGESTAVQNNDGDTPLHVAVRFRRLDVVKLLLDRGASTTVHKNYGDSLLHIAVRYFKPLLDRGALTTVQNKCGETPLHTAVRYNDLDSVHILLDRGASPTVQKNDGDTPLHIAVKYSTLDVVKLLLDRGASTTIQNNDGNTPLHEALKSINLDTLKLLLDRGASITVQNNDGDTPLHEAVRRINLDTVKLLLDRGASITVQNNIGDTPLHAAVRCINLDKVKLLLDRGASTTVQNNNGDTPFHVGIIYKDSVDQVKLLLDRGASTAAQNKDGDTPLHKAVRCINLDQVKLLLDRGASTTVQNNNGCTPLHEAVRRITLDTVKLLLDRGASTTIQNNDGNTPLHEALKSINLDTLKLLLDRGASITVQNNDGDTPLHEAVRRINLDTVKLLLDRGASITVQNNIGDTPLHAAVRCINLDKVKLLLDRGASTTVQNNNGDTPLHVGIIYKDSVDQVKLLLDRGASTAAQNKDGDTPLHKAVRCINLDKVKLLLDRGASTTVQNNNGDTPLHEAVRRINLDTVKLLLDRGASITVQNNTGDTPLHAAVRCINLDKVKLLLDRGASTTVQNNNGDTPFHVGIIYKDSVDQVKLLLDRGASTAAQNKDGDTPLHKAVRCINLDQVKLLLDRGASTTVQNNNGCTPLHIAVERRYCSTVKLLLEKGVNVNVINRNGDTPLSIAERLEHTEIVTLLKDCASKC